MSRVAVKLLCIKEQGMVLNKLTHSRAEQTRLRTIKMHRRSFGARAKSRVLSSGILLSTCAIKY